MRRTALLLLLPLSGLLPGCGEDTEGAVTGAETPPAVTRVAARPGQRPGLESALERLPEGVAGFTRRDITWHERQRAGMGAAVDYDGPARSAVSTVSVYDRGRAAVPDDVNDPALQAEFSEAVREALALAGTRTSQQLAERDRTDVAVPGQAPMRCARLLGTYGRQEVQTLVCLGGAAGRFLKVLVTSPSRQVRPVDPLPFVVGIAQAARG